MKSLHSSKGSVLLVALIFAMVLAVTVGSFVSLSIGTLQHSTRNVHYNNALNVAEAGLEQAMWALNNSFESSPLSWTSGGTEANPTRLRTGSSGSLDLPDVKGFYSIFIENSFTVEAIRTHIVDMQKAGATTDEIRAWLVTHIPTVHARGVVQPPTGPALTKNLKLKLAIRSPWENGMVGRTRIDLDGGDVGSYDSTATATVPANLAAMGYGITVASPTSVIGNVAIGTPADIKGHLSIGIGTENSTDFLASIKGSITGPTSPSGITVDPNLISYDFNESYADTVVPTNTGTGITQLTALPARTTTGPNAGWTVIGDPTGATLQRYTLTGNLGGDSKNPANLLVVGPVQIIVPGGSFAPEGMFVLDGTKAIPQLDKTGKVTSTTDTTVGKGLAEVYVEGDIVLNGAPGSLNDGSRPSLLRVFSTLSAAEAAAGNTQNVFLNGNANITALIYAPYGDVKLNGGGSKGFFAGALVANTIKIGGSGYRFVYDVSAANEDITGFRLSRWIEFVKGPDPVAY